MVCKMNGRSIIRTKPEHYCDRKSPDQPAQRQRMKVVNEFKSPFLELIRLTFPPQKAGRTARSKAQSYSMRNAVAGEYPDIYADKSRALLSRGPLPVPMDATVTSGPDGLLIEWVNDANTATNHRFGTLMVMAVTKGSDPCKYSFTRVKRTEGRYAWKLSLSAGPASVWIAFRNQEQTEMSDSIHLGEM